MNACNGRAKPLCCIVTPTPLNLAKHIRTYRAWREQVYSIPGCWLVTPLTVWVGCHCSCCHRSQLRCRLSKGSRSSIVDAFVVLATCCTCFVVKCVYKCLIFAYFGRKRLVVGWALWVGPNQVKQPNTHAQWHGIIVDLLIVALQADPNIYIGSQHSLSYKFTHFALIVCYKQSSCRFLALWSNSLVCMIMWFQNEVDFIW